MADIFASCAYFIDVYEGCKIDLFQQNSQLHVNTTAILFLESKGMKNDITKSLLEPMLTTSHGGIRRNQGPRSESAILAWFYFCWYNLQLLSLLLCHIEYTIPDEVLCIYAWTERLPFCIQIFKCIFRFRILKILKYHGSLLLMVQLTVNAHWVGCWLNDNLATIHYLNHCWPISKTPYGIISPQ